MKAIKIILAIILGVCLICGGFAIANELHQNAMNEYIDSFGRVEIENQLVPELDEAGRIEEIARILGGIEVSDTQRQAAREMIYEI